MTKALLDAGALPNAEILASALSRGENEAAMLMLDAGVSPAAFERPEGFGTPDVPDPSPELAARIIACNDVNQTRSGYPGSMLLLACRAGMDVEVVKLLVESGAEFAPGRVFLNTKLYGIPDNSLLNAAMDSKRDNPELVSYLIEIGISPVIGNKSYPLFLAHHGRYKKPESARILINAGANPLELRKDRFAREFAVKSKILDKNDYPLIQGYPAPSVLRRQSYEQGAAVRWVNHNPSDALSKSDFYSVATPEIVRQAVSAIKKEYSENKGLLAYREYLNQNRDKKDFYGRETTPRYSAARHSPYPEVIDILWSEGFRGRNICTALKGAFENSNPEVALALIRHNKNFSCLHENVIWAADAQKPPELN